MASYDVLEVTGRGDREIGASGTFISSPPSEHIPPELQQRNLTHPHETSNTQLPSRRDAGFEDPRVRLAQVESDLGREQYAHEGTRIELRSTKRSLDATMVELNSTKTELESTKIGLESTKQSLEETRARWKGIVKEFNHFQAQSRKFVQLDDQVLLQKVSQLRFNIRNCILEHFEGNQPILTKDMDALWKYVSSFQPKHIGAPFQSFNELEATVQTPARRIIFLRSFLWLFLTVDILGQSLWAGKTIAGGYHKIGKAVGHLDRDAAVDSADSIEAERKFYLWKATTTAYLDETIGLDEPQCRKEREDLAKEKASIFCDYLGCLSTSKDQRLVRTITSIVLEALELDLLISRQVARVKWVYSINNGPQRFNQGLMDAEEEPGDYIYLFLAPALVKQGKSNGDDFDKSTILLKSQVICGPGDATVQSESHRGSAAESGRSFGSRMAKTLRTAVRGLPPGA